ncbi:MULTISPECIES: PEP-CTERM sorting domain-containing protein [unclassified Microcoleus]|uniref:PEP-CTERM sorting domain-containing protein n=1 Tax=unclassified Microcoleus TaxID=2642155 RepID=UPI001D7D19EC|nr:MULTISPECIES: PEP-CTERM sorting domain-containing protein [unclassified Microcoleus]MCC3507264.1 PEP-CTERM sorting domain-containing protein [Microcoleus sp. PH2017_19_SFW_U_A]TAE05497.1 MAG: PEP-CTERM sorting domain-containing protein [Oscillatoriales cyanobacterium]MCC3416040.1 PEP-CTERM sorting domain-containing protein [Microcoleus sp. PH2017_02_FOX_O_A]MCC3494947.1 PEP-CTERM sorting domain-containing protein [Microcoleus sp. PH2017_16_JOR_D_A]MCC3519889.1 PEP-CTERM sorting domain-conta
MNGYQKLGLAVVSGALGFSAFNSMVIPVQAAVLTQTYTVNLKQPVNSTLNGVLPKFNSLLGTLLSAYVKVESTVNSDINIVPASNFTGTAVTNAQIAVNLPSLKADPNLVLSLFVNPPEMSIESGAAGARGGSASGIVSRSYSSPQYLNMFSGCAGDLIAASIVAMGNVRVLGTPTTVTYAGTVTTDSKLTLAYEYESESETVPEPTTIAGVGLAFGLGCWWKRKVGKRTFK